MNRDSIRYRRASFVEHLKVHRDNPLKLEIQHLIDADPPPPARGRRWCWPSRTTSARWRWRWRSSG